MVAANLLNKLRPSLIFCVLTFSSHVMAQDLYPEHELDITTPTQVKGWGKKNKLATKRVQLKMLSDSVCSVFITRVNKFPHYIRKVEIQTTDSLSGQHKIKIRKKSIRKSLIEWQEVTIPTVSARLDGDANYFSQMTRYKKNVKRFAEGKNGGRFVMNQWQRLATFSLPRGSSIQKMKVKTGFFKTQEYILNSTIASASQTLPAVDDDNCVPFDRFFERKKLAGYGLENLKYVPYSLPRKIERRAFEVYFEKGKSTVSGEELNGITEYLRANNLTIIRATVEGYSSIEGTLAENEKLQKERARLLLKTLQRHNNEPILNDTVLVHDGWAELRKAVTGSPFRWLDSLTKEEVIQRLDSDETLREELEPYLRTQRKAMLTLTLSRSITTDEIVKRLTTDFQLAANLLRDPLNKEVYQVNEKKAMGILAYAEGLAQAGKISYQQIAELADNSSSPERTRVLLFYHTIKTMEEKRNNHEQLDTLFSQYKWNNIFVVANENITSLVHYTHSQEEKRIRLRQAVDVQYFTFKYIEEGLLDVSVLYSIQYPNNRSFYGLQLNLYAFLYEYAKNHSLPDNDSIDEPNSIDTSFDALFASLDGKYTSRPEFLSKLVNQDFVSPMLTPVTFDTDQESDYYFFLKTLFMTQDEKIREFVLTSDQMIEFDLFDFISIQMDNWNPYSNHFHDKDIQLKELHKLIQKLKSINKRICPVDANQLYLDYHLKALYYLSLYWNPTNNEHVKIADASLAYIANYYMARKEKMDPILEEQIKHQLNLFYWLPSRNASVLYYK